MLDCHVNAFLIKPGKVMGRNLRPMTLAHLWLLEAIGSPYAFTKCAASYSDTLTAVMVVSLPAALAKWIITRPFWQRVYMRLFFRLGRIADDVAAAESYFAAYKAHPDRVDSKTSTSRRTCTPASVSIAWVIMGKVGERRAWSMPIPLAMTYLVAESEANGSEYISEHDKRMAQLNSNFGKEPANG
jgi:hypothetical protein